MTNRGEEACECDGQANDKSCFATFPSKLRGVPVSRACPKGGATEETRLVRAEVSRCRSTDPGTPTRREGRTFLNHKEDPIMPSNRPKHTEASSRVPTSSKNGGDLSNAIKNERFSQGGSMWLRFIVRS
jgi:hypothetical protein